MEEDSAGNITDMEKSTKFSVSAALRQWLSISNHSKSNEIFEKYMTISKWKTSYIENCLNDISKMMLLYGRAVNGDFVQLFGPILLDLLERCLQSNLDADVKHKQMCVLLSRLEVHNQTILEFTLQYFQNHPAPFQSDNLNEPPPKRSKTNSGPSELELIESCYRLLFKAPNFFRNAWDWSCFLKAYSAHPNHEIQWIACQCLAKVFSMSEAERLNLLSKTFTEDENMILSLKYFVSPSNERLLRAKSSGDLGEVSKDSLSEGIVDVEGVLIPSYSKVVKDVEALVPVLSTRTHLQSIALAITSCSPILITGPVGCGKTCLVEYVAALTGRSMENQGLLKVQLGDQTDSKVLLGTYHSTDVPGEFVWTAGVLTQAVREGRWLLLEDIDYAPMDVVSMLLPLIESRTLNVPGHGDVIRAAPGFQLFATQRLSHNETSVTNAATMLKRMWRRVVVEPLSRSELLTVIETRYPTLCPLADKLLDVYYLLNEGQKLPGINLQINDRVISPRDFFKWCQRITTENRDETTSLTSINAQLHLFQDAMDCFIACLLKAERRLQICEDIGAKLNLLKAKAEFYNNTYKPMFHMSDDVVVIGRANLHKTRHSTEAKATFSWTRNSSVLLERLAVCVRQNEPVLLVGETGTGKTSTVQYLAHLLGHRLLVINLNQQSDSADLLGGYKPIDLKYKVGPIRQEFEHLFQNTFSVHQNARFLSHVATCYANRRWNDLLKLMRHSQTSALEKCHDTLRSDWEQLGYKLKQLQNQIRHADTALAFSFVEGSLVQALKRGDWVLLDEINLASADTLECLSGLLESQHGSLFLLERGDREPVHRHPEFRLFAAMNPATDVGKKQLPTGLRSRFTEFFVDEISSPQDLATLVGDYLRDLNLTSSQIEGIVKFYLEIRGEALKTLTDGTGRQPHYSLRTLCRALMIASSNPCGTVARSLYEGFCLSFLTQLDRASHPLVENLVTKNIIGKKNLKSVLRQVLPQPQLPTLSGRTLFVEVEGYWVPQGDLEPCHPEAYILTDSVRRNLRDLVRVVSLGRLPILLQGETSVGKTSLISYLAQLTGNKCVRVNNHEHTDLQEYVGSYTADASGKLVFREGVLVDAMRRGYWLILDELNLAPSEVLEALNRLLDDNRELFITETQENVRAHPRFLLFATQNPPGGQYGGRKLLSRAFRNRFVELHFDEIPPEELEIILHKRCAMPPSYCKRLVAVMRELQLRRRGSAAFAGKAGFMTLRDLFRWAERYRLATGNSDTFYDWDRHLADEGYLVLAGRVRKDEDCQVIREVLEKHFKTSVNPQQLFTLDENTSPVTRPILEALYSSNNPDFGHLVWTYSLRRLAVLVGQALRFVEPVLLVGDTGCGKTTVCQYLAAQRNCQLLTVNCHQYSEGSDFLGGLRPIRHHERVANTTTEEDTESAKETQERLFEWVDGPLVLSMKGGHVFLADEISLADDSVLERLNSVLEPERSLLLAEKAGGSEPEIVKAADGFRFVSTMNPGGDYGKKELSPALRNRLTEIWCPISREKQEITDIVEHNLRQPWIALQDREEGKRISIASAMVEFIDWFSNTDGGRRSTISIRDILSWVQFINTVTLNNRVDAVQAYIHGGCLVFLDSVGIKETVDAAIHQLCRPFPREMIHSATMDLIFPGNGCEKDQLAVVSDDRSFGVDPFFIEKGQLRTRPKDIFTFQAPSTAINLIRLLRALQLKKPLLLEGSPGVGKTSLVAALAHASGHQLVRINLSEQTDVSDLFGADLPVEGSEVGGHFQWRDGPLLRALKEGHWIVLDELNLASQSVLEGLNAVLDHRGELYIPELGRSFHVRTETTKLFACQNPMKQGGARKGLPRSFLNRFTQVYVEPLSLKDLEFIAISLYPEIDAEVINKMVAFNQSLVSHVLRAAEWGVRGSPWEFNLRDIFRWCQAISNSMTDDNKSFQPGRYVGIIYADRMRTTGDREKMLQTYEQVFGPSYPLPREERHVYVTDSWVQVGSAILPRRSVTRHSSPVIESETTTGEERNLLLLQRCLQPLESLMHCIKFNWMSILVGRRASGKTSLIQLVAQLTGHPLDILTTNSAMDTTELLGGFEQGDLNRSLEQIASQVNGLRQWTLRNRVIAGQISESADLLELWETYNKQSTNITGQTSAQETQQLEQRARILMQLLTKLENMETIRAQVGELKGKLSRLMNQLVKPSKGGRFEWIDSLLVKALREGHWLLIDNVNLCSSSVLDRLNGLLEPGGVLTLSERGVIDGDIPTIEPHPEFRLFLAMDPRHGEISRAMRNRGIEIYLFDSEEVEFTDSDLHSILKIAGLHSPLLQKTLIRFHQSLCQLLSSGEQPTLTELLQAASLTAQRLEMFAANPLSSLDDACVEVYVKNIRFADREAARFLLSDVLQSVLQTEENRYDGEFSVMEPSTVSTRELELSSTLARIRQASVLVERQLTNDPTALNDSILLLYLTCSIQDINWRQHVLEQLLMKKGNALEGARAFHQTLVPQLRKHLEHLKCPVDLPWDPRWFHSIWQQHFRDDPEHRMNTTINNRLSLDLFRAFFEAREAVPISDGSVGWICRAITMGTLAEEAVPHRIFVILPQFLDIFDDTVKKLLSSPDVHFDNEEWAALFQAVRWRFDLKDVFHLPVSMAELEVTVARVAQYWAWILKWTIPVVQKLLDRFPVMSSLATMAGQVSNSLSLTNLTSPCLKEKLHVVSRRLRRFIEEPPVEPFINESHARLARIINNIFSSRTFSYARRQRSCHLAYELSEYLIDSCSTSSVLRDQHDIDTMAIKLSGLLNELVSADVTNLIAEADDERQISSFRDHLVLLQHHALTNCRREVTDALGHVMASMLKRVPTMSAALLRAYYMTVKNDAIPWPELHLTHWETMINLSSSRLTSNIHQTNSEEKNTPNKRLSLSAPVLSLAVANVTQNPGISLSQSVEKKNQLELLKQLLWNSQAQIQRRMFDPLHNDHLLASNSFKHFIRAICVAVRVPEPNDVNNEPSMEEVLESWNDKLPRVIIDLVRSAWKSLDDAEVEIGVGSLWLLLGLSRCVLFAANDNVDPVEKRKLKMSICQREAKTLGRFLNTQRLQQILLAGSCTADIQHPHIRHFARRFNDLEKQMQENEIRKPTWRPVDSSLYHSFVKDVRHFVSSVSSPESVLELWNKLRCFDANLHDHRLVISQAELWISAQRTFYESLKDKYIDLPDLIVPLLTGIAQMIHGAESLKNRVEKLVQMKAFHLVHLGAVDDGIADLFDRPSRMVASLDSGILKLADLCTSDGVGRLFDVLESSDVERDQSKKILLLSALKEVERYAFYAQRIDSETWNTQLSILDVLVALWNAAQERQRRLLEEKESLYKSRSIVHEGQTKDSEADKQALELYFPSYDYEFGEGTSGLDEEAMEVDESCPAGDLNIQLTCQDEIVICQSHVDLLSQWSRSMVMGSPPGWNSITSCRVNSSGFAMRYPFLTKLTKTLQFSLNTQFDRRLAASHISYIHHTILTNPDNQDRCVAGAFDFYYDPCVDEATLCRPILEHLDTRIDQLLSQWPGHATLIDIKKLDQRILSFDIQSPLMKLVTGLELLLTKCQEWEMNAHKGVSIAEDIQAVSRLILRWRTLELDCWKVCLNSVEKRSASGSAKYWFHMYSTVTSLINESCGESFVENLWSFQKTLRQFMENSSLGQFEARLRMLRAFACHVQERINRPDHGQHHHQLLRVLWNAFLFYSQFEATVAKKKSTLRQPIDKKVKDFVKIMRWNDVNYYALKEAVNKAHQTLHKHMKEWHQLLEQPVKPFLNEPGTDQEINQGSQHGFAETNYECFVSRVTMENSEFPGRETYPLLSRLPTLSSRSRKLCGSLLAKSPFEQKIREVDDLVGIIASTTSDLQKLQVIAGDDKERQRREAKSISLRKRKALSELFRCLQQLGISYRRGSSMWKEQLAAFNEILPVLQVDSTLNHLPKRASHSAIQQFWNQCPLYYTRCISRLTTLGKLLEKPSTELGPAIVERCKGFAAQFMVIIQDQWKQCSKTHDSLVALSLIVVQLSGTFVASNDADDSPDFATFVELVDRLRGLVVDGLAVLDEFEDVMKACPDSNQEDQFYLFFEPQNWITVSKTDSVTLLSSCQEIRSKLVQLRQELDQKFNLFWITRSSYWLFDSIQWNCVKKGYETLDELRNRLDKMAKQSDQTGFGSTLHQLSQRLTAAVDAFHLRQIESRDDGSCDDMKDLEKLCQSMLHGIQEIYKKYVGINDAEDQEPVDDSDEFEQNHLTEKIMKEIIIDLSQLLKLDRTVEDATKLVRLFGRDRRKDPRALLACSALIDQYVYVVEYYFSMQLAMLRTSSKLQSVLLNVFNQLLEKGFCLPSELDESDRGTGSKFEDIDSGGLGDGQGAKDVSDQIENEDQLESAQQPGDEGQDQDEAGASKEEEHGIEMSEDFDAKMQDREKKEEGEGDGSEDEDEGDDLDKQMGETGQDADQLEEKLWGSDEDEDDGDDEQEEEGKGDGKKSESELTAKTGEDDSDEANDPDGSNKKKEKPRHDPAEEEDPDQVNDDQIDPYHGSHDPPPEPEALDVPDDLNLDGGDPDREDGANETEENPFDIDATKNNDLEMENADEGSDHDEKEGETEEGNEETETHQADTKDQTGEEGTDDETGDKEADKEMEKSDDIPPDDSQQSEQQAVPSHDRPAESEAQPAADQATKGSQDKTAQKQHEMERQDGGTNQEAENEDKEGVGMAESRQAQGHEGQEESKVNRQMANTREEQKNQGQSKPKKPGQADPERALAEVRKERVLQVHTTSTIPENDQDPNQGPEHDENAPDHGQDTLYEHVKKVDQRYDALARDAATEEQAKEQMSIQDKDQEPTPKDEEEALDDIVMKDENQLENQEPVDQIEAERIAGRNQKKGQRRGDPNVMEETDPDTKMEVEGETTQTMSAKRGPDSSYVTQTELLVPPVHNVTMEEIEQLRNDIEQRLSSWNASQIDDSQGQETWKQLEMVTSGLAQDLCEQLRLILEPSQASRLKGDYRTGKRLNMRKVIPYIASQFRKDRIWLRRTKPAQRNYQIVLAVDDSSSMADNRSKELAFESVALISKALCLLEAGQLGVVSFGEQVQMLHPLHDTFSDSSGPRILQQFTFEQKKTRISKLVDFVTAMMTQAKSSATHLSSTAQLLLIVSDGRGLFSEGTECVLQSIRRAKQSGLFMVFVIIDNPDSKDSILDIRVPVFDPAGKLLGIKPYLDNFPFPFYVILRDIQTLPVVLSDALRQWFELVTSSVSV